MCFVIGKEENIDHEVQRVKELRNRKWHNEKIENDVNLVVRCKDERGRLENKM